ncbi:hypothetical protein BV898_12529 [Hypsibius exemplaris]|uniref:Uncharacterized protein n=1 Tax=Hypsibius exemplaris TaxID=2072580 RepID=A0A1W0WDB6_HYPEX|nr:hypothetical protein BV898_12529 [Hypsibius exemplaris]
MQAEDNLLKYVNDRLRFIDETNPHATEEEKAIHLFEGFPPHLKSEFVTDMPNTIIAVKKTNLELQVADLNNQLTAFLKQQAEQQKLQANEPRRQPPNNQWVPDGRPICRSCGKQQPAMSNQSPCHSSQYQPPIAPCQSQQMFPQLEQSATMNAVQAGSSFPALPPTETATFYASPQQVEQQQLEFVSEATVSVASERLAMDSGRVLACPTFRSPLPRLREEELATLEEEEQVMSPRPKDAAAVRSFVDTVMYYSKYLPALATVAHLLIKMSRKGET